MVLLRLKVSNLQGEGNKPVQVTTAMLDVIPSPGAVSLVSLLLFSLVFSLSYSLTLASYVLIQSDPFRFLVTFQLNLRYDGMLINLATSTKPLRPTPRSLRRRSLHCS